MIRSNTTILEAAAAHLGVAVPPKEKKIPRPPNAYILYRKERHNVVRDAHPGITNNEICKYLPPLFSMEYFLTMYSPSFGCCLERRVARGPTEV